MRAKLIVDPKEAEVPARSVLVADRPERFRPLSNPESWKILTELARRPDYPGALARRLRMHEQKVYYHIRRLAAAGLIRVVREERRQGAMSRIFAPTADAFALELPTVSGGRAPSRRAIP
ncbi:MAG TPA: helix-turn-helix domain-containing protein, partial [Thermoplasmata archaeon]|nr:helix-turn-helix domain-containing protein [Thermoplasmata archaeon]